MWRPEVSPATLILEPAPTGFEATSSFDLGTFGPVRIERADADGRELVILDALGGLHIRLHDKQAAPRPAVLLPLDSMFELRLDVALRFVRRLGGQRIAFLPIALRPTSFQKRRPIHLLHAFDIHDEGGGPREVATEVLDSERARLPSIEWKDSLARRAANRLIHDAIAQVNRGYLKLLRGR